MTTSDEEYIRQGLLADIDKKMRDIRLQLIHIKNCYKPIYYDFSDCTNDGLSEFLKVLNNVEETFEKFSDENIDKELWGAVI